MRTLAVRAMSSSGPASGAQAVTQRLYYQDTFLHTCKAKVLSVGTDDAGYFTIPDKTVSTCKSKVALPPAATDAQLCCRYSIHRVC